MGCLPPDLRTKEQCLSSCFLFRRLGSYLFPEAQWLSADQIVLPDDRLSKFCLRTKQSQIEGFGSPLCSNYCASQRLELAQKWVAEIHLL